MNTAARTTAKKETIWTTFGITTMALMTTMLIVSTYIKIPLPFSTASITAQTLVVNLIGMLFAPLQIVAIMVSWLLLESFWDRPADTVTATQWQPSSFPCSARK